MAQRIRTLFFWLHLTTGLVVGLVVLVMSVTGVLLTFEKQMVWRADTAHLTATGGAATSRLPIDELLARVRATGLVNEPSCDRRAARPGCTGRAHDRRRHGGLRRPLHGPPARHAATRACAASSAP